MAIDIPDELLGKTPEELLDIVERLDQKLRSIHQDINGEMREKTPEEQAEFSRGLLVRDTAEKLIKQHQKIREGFARGSVETALGASRGRTTRDAMSDLDPTSVVRMGAGEARDGALRALETRGRKLEPDQADQVDALLRSVIGDDNPNTDGSYIAKRTLITESDAYRSAWKQLVTEPHPLLTAQEVEAVRALKELDRVESRAMSEGTTTAGGFGVPVFIDPSIILTAQGADNPFFELAKNVTITTNVWKGVSSGGVSWSFDAEAAEVSDDTPTLAQPSVTVHMARGFVPFSIEVGQDYPGFAEEMAALLAAGYDDLLLDKMTRGSGTGEPQGILTVLSANTNVRVKVTTAGTIVAADPYKVWKAVPQRYRRRASWLMSVGVNNAIRQTGTQDALHALSAQLPAAWLDQLFRRRVAESPYMPDTTTTTAATEGYAIVGDFSNYVLAKRAGLSVELVQHLIGTTNNRPTGQRGWFAYGRIGGASVNDLGFRLLVNS